MICQYCLQETEPEARFHEGLGSCGKAFVERLRSQGDCRAGTITYEIAMCCGELMDQVVDLRKSVATLQAICNKAARDLEHVNLLTSPIGGARQ